MFLGPWIAFTIFANSLYHIRVKKKIAAAQRSIQDSFQLLEFLRHKGGVHKWVIGVCILLPVIGILAAIAIPQYNTYKQRSYSIAKKEKNSLPPGWKFSDEADQYIAAPTPQSVPKVAEAPLPVPAPARLPAPKAAEAPAPDPKTPSYEDMSDEELLSILNASSQTVPKKEYLPKPHSSRP